VRALTVRKLRSSTRPRLLAAPYRFTRFKALFRQPDGFAACQVNAAGWMQEGEVVSGFLGPLNE
jgi:hypothetical protein